MSNKITIKPDFKPDNYNQIKIVGDMPIKPMEKPTGGVYFFNLKF